jgi:hypothetical protein
MLRFLNPKKNSKNPKPFWKEIFFIKKNQISDMESWKSSLIFQ